MFVAGTGREPETMGNKAVARAFVFVSMVGLITALGAAIIGHLGLGAGYDPLQLTISDYALSDRGSAIDIAMVALAVGALALLFALNAAGVNVRTLPSVLVLVWSAGLIVAAVVPTDPIGASHISMTAYVHRYASVTAFIALPVAGAVLAARLARTDAAWAGTVATVRRLCAACAFGLALLWWDAFPGGRAMMGLVERCLVAVEIALLAVFVVAVLRATSRAGSGPTTDPAGQSRQAAHHDVRTADVASPVYVFPQWTVRATTSADRRPQAVQTSATPVRQPSCATPPTMRTRPGTVERPYEPKIV